MSNKESNLPDETQESPHRLIEHRLEKMEELGKQVPLYPYSYDRSHTSVEMRAQESAPAAAAGTASST